MALLEPIFLTIITEDRKFMMKNVFSVFLSKYGRESDSVIILFLTCIVLSILQHLREKNCKLYPNFLELFLNGFFLNLYNDDRRPVSLSRQETVLFSASHSMAQQSLRL